jgi:hypothetical protein
MQKNLPSARWRELVSRIIKTEMAKKNLKYEDLSQLLQARGTLQSSANLRNKINRGIMGADLFLLLLLVMDVKQLNQALILEILHELQP